MFKRTIRKCLLATIICFVLIAQGSTCYAYYWNWGGLGYNNIGSSLLWPINSFMPYSSYGSSAYGLGWPLFNLAHMGNRYANNMAINSYRNIPNAQSNNNFAPTGTNNNYPFNAYSPNYSAVTAPSWNQSQLGQPAPTQSLSNDPNDVFNYRYPTTPGLSNTSSSLNPPPTAPDRHASLQAINQASRESTPNQATYSPYPIAPPLSTAQNIAVIESFFQTVTTRYKGDLLRALNQPDMQSWAQSLNLIDPGQKLPTTLSKARKSEISTILKDNSLDAYHKLSLLRLLII